jgi:hypothetical protein
MTDLRPIDIADLPTQTLREQPGPMLQWVPIDRLRIDTRYQRPMIAGNWKQVLRIAVNFDWCAFGPILCAPVAGDLFAVIDGQHRAHAAALCGIEAVPAMIVPVPPHRQAIAFVQVNSGIRVSAHQTFRAELSANDPEALAIQKAVADAGCEALTYNPSAATRKPGQLSCVGLLRKLVRAGLADDLTAALRALRAYDTTGRVALYSDHILEPWVAAVARSRTRDTPGPGTAKTMPPAHAAGTSSPTASL